MGNEIFVKKRISSQRQKIYKLKTLEGHDDDDDGMKSLIIGWRDEKILFRFCINRVVDGEREDENKKKKWIFFRPFSFREKIIMENKRKKTNEWKSD